MRGGLGSLTVATVLATAASLIAPAWSQAPTSIRVGWSISKTGPYAGGANVTTLPNYQVWVKDVNDAGGIMLSSLGKKLPLEVVEYDDRSSDRKSTRLNSS